MTEPTNPFVIHVHKAAPTIESEPVRGAIINITRDQPEFNPRMADLGESDIRFGADAMVIEMALHDALPGGTYDRLVGQLLKRKATHFRVAHFVSEAIK